MAGEGLSAPVTAALTVLRLKTECGDGRIRRIYGWEAIVMSRYDRAPAPPPKDRRRGGKPRRNRRSGLLYFFAAVGVIAVCFLAVRFLIIPLLVALA